jgi:hypothetical protein
VAGVVGGVLAVHPVIASRDRVQAGIAARIAAATPPAATIATVSADLEKYVHPAAGARTLVAAHLASPEAMPELLRKAGTEAGGAVFMVAVERSADPYEREVAGLARDYRERLARTCDLRAAIDEEVVPGARLLVHRVNGCAGARPR